MTPTAAAPRMRRIPLARLLPSPAGPRRAPARTRKAWAAHLQRRLLYPPLIVRPAEGPGERFELIDGHLRARCLAEAGQDSARCEVWAVGADEARMLRLMLNGLLGRSEPRQRAREICMQADRMGPEQAVLRLGLTEASLRQQRTLAEGPTAAEPPHPATMAFRPLVFHLRPEQAEAVRKAIAKRRRGRESRAETLARMLLAPPASPGR